MDYCIHVDDDFAELILANEDGTETKESMELEALYILTFEIQENIERVWNRERQRKRDIVLRASSSGAANSSEQSQTDAVTNAENSFGSKRRL